MLQVPQPRNCSRRRAAPGIQGLSILSPIRGGGGLRRQVSGQSLYGSGGTPPEGGRRRRGGCRQGCGGTPTYEDWLALNCPPPLDIDKYYVYNLRYYPGSGMQHRPWEVYGLMYGAAVATKVLADADPGTL